MPPPQSVGPRARVFEKMKGSGRGGLCYRLGVRRGRRGMALDVVQTHLDPRGGVCPEMPHDLIRT